MERYWPLIDGLFAAATLTTLFVGFYWAIWGGPNRIRRSVRDRLGPVAIKHSMRPSVFYWLFVTILSFIIVIALGNWFWHHLDQWLMEEIFQGTWQAWLAYKLNVTLFVLSHAVDGMDYAFKLPLGFLFAIFIGLLIGAGLGTSIGRRVAAKQFLITSQMY